MGRSARVHAFLSAVAGLAAVAQTAAASARETPSGLPVPRFVSVRDADAPCRIGPSRAHPTKYVFRKRGAPLLVVAETRDHWRKVRDVDGDECWIFHTSLRAATHAISSKECDLTGRPGGRGPVRARLAAGVMARVDRVRGDDVFVQVGAVRGWSALGDWWGAGAPAATGD
ncbi:MAG: SH3 domain-containing protein [Parvularculaceae bacterium]